MGSIGSTGTTTNSIFKNLVFNEATLNALKSELKKHPDDEKTAEIKKRIKNTQQDIKKVRQQLKEAHTAGVSESKTRTKKEVLNTLSKNLVFHQSGLNLLKTELKKHPDDGYTPEIKRNIKETEEKIKETKRKIKKYQ